MGDIGVVSAPFRHSIRLKLFANGELDDDVEAGNIRLFRYMVKLLTHSYPQDDHRARLDLAARFFA